MNYTMEMTCFNCKKKAKTGEAYHYYETDEGLVYFCSEKCDNEYRKKVAEQGVDEE